MKRKTLRNKTVRRDSVGFWLGVLIGLLLLGSLMGPAFRQAKAQQQELTITLVVQTSDPGCIVPFKDYLINFNERTLATKGTNYTRDLKISSGPNRIKVTVAGNPNVIVDRVVVGTSEENKRTYPGDLDGYADVDFNANLDEPTVFVYLSGLCADDTKDVEKEKPITLSLTTFDCGLTPQWSGLVVKIGQIELAAESAEEATSGLAAGQSMGRLKEAKITPGRLEISVSSTNFPRTRIGKVSVARFFHASDGRDQLKGSEDYAPDASGHVWVDLDRSLWEKNSRFGSVFLTVELMGNCEDPMVDTSQFGIFTVKSVSGEMEAQQPLLKNAPGPSSPRVGVRYTKGTFIKTGKDGLIVLESEYKHKITIYSSTEVRLDDLMTPTGRKLLTASMKRGRIKIERKGSDLQGSSTNSSVQTGSATVDSDHTIYDVSYEESTKVTTVNVDEGRVQVFPRNESLQSVTLNANEQVQVSDNRVIRGRVTLARTPLLLYVGIGIGGLVVLIVLIVIIYLIYRSLKGSASQPVAVRPRMWHAPPQQAGHRPCPNPRCRALMPTTTNFCGVCGSTLP